MTIRTTGPGADRGRGKSDHFSWGRFWEVGTTLTAKCVRAGKEGVQTKLGEYNEIFVRRTDFSWCASALRGRVEGVQYSVTLSAQGLSP